MSDEDDYPSEESYEFEFEEDDDENEVQDQNSTEDSPENQYYYAKGLKDDSLEDAAKGFEQLIGSANSADDTEWAFKAHKQLAKIQYQQRQYSLVLTHVGHLMDMLPALNGNYAEESISKILTRYAASENQPFVKELYDIIVSHLQDFHISGSSGHRLWFKISINRLNQYLETGDLASCRELIAAINERLDIVSESTRNSYALEIIAAEIMYTMKTGGSEIQLGALYRKSLAVNSAITHPQVMGVIRECGATVQFYKGNYDKARLEFYECFKSYDEAGSSSKRKVLKYLTLCCVLVESEVNPFESQETQSYAQLAEYKYLIAMVDAYEKLDLAAFLRVEHEMVQAQDPLAQDPIFVAAQKAILHNLKVNVLQSLAKAYDTLRFDFVAAKLYLPDERALEKLLLQVANGGTIPNLKVNFVKRYIQFKVQGEKRIPGRTLDAKAVSTNVLSLHRLAYEGPMQDPAQSSEQNMQNDEFGSEMADFRHSATQLNALMEEEQVPGRGEADIFEKFFGSSALKVAKTPEREEWLKYIASAIPEQAILASTQKELVQSQMREESEESSASNPENEEAEASTNRGILGSSVAISTPHEHASEPESTKSKSDLLHEWAHKLISEVHC